MGTERNSESFGDLVRELTRNLSIVIRGEIAIIRMEIRNAVATLSVVAALFILAGLLGFCAYIFFLMMLHSLFVQLLGPWLGQLVVMVILLITAGIVVFVGVKKLEKWKIGGVGPDSVGAVGDTEGAATAPAEERSDGNR